MSAVKTYLAGGAFVTFLAAIPGWFMADPAPVSPIVVHSIEFDQASWSVTQSRTIQGAYGDAVPLQWAARVFDVETGETVPECHGAGAYAYPVGSTSPSMPLPVWVGHEACAPSALIDGRVYQLSATWWQDDHAPVTAYSEPFEVTP